MKYDEIFRCKLLENFLLKRDPNFQISTEEERECEFFLAGEDYYEVFKNYCITIANRLSDYEDEIIYKNQPGANLYNFLKDFNLGIFYYSESNDKENKGKPKGNVLVSIYNKAIKFKKECPERNRSFDSEYFAYIECMHYDNHTKQQLTELGEKRLEYLKEHMPIEELIVLNGLILEELIKKGVNTVFLPHKDAPIKKFL